MGFKIEHLAYGGAIKGRLKGQIPWNAGTSIWIDCKCLECGEKFKIRELHYKRGEGKYCSKKCFNKSLIGKVPWNKRVLETKLCLWCNKSFNIRPCEKDRKFCSKQCANNFRIGKKIEPFTEEHKRKIGESNRGKSRWGKQSNHWKGGITPFYNLLRTLDEYNKWRMDCLKRDWFKCQECDSKKDLEVHHIIPFQKLVNEFLQQYNQFSIIDDRETLLRLAITYESFWEINNGITYCEKCHKSLRGVRCQ